MAGIIYPDFARSIGGALQLHQNEQQNAFQMDRMRRADEADAREREASQYVPGALSGDRDALGKVATLSPKTAMSIAPLLERMDSNQRARLKEQFEATGKAAAGILALPEADQPAAYEATYQALTQQGYKINLPPRWSPALKGQLQSYAMQVPEYLKMLGDQPQPMGGVPGGMPAPAGGGAPGDVLVRTKQAIAGNESSGQPNGGYGAVGPDTGSGKRAYGKYQVMDFNVGPWTQEALGRPMTPQEFLASPEAQEAVADFKLGQYIKQFGSPEAAARAWFAGPGGMNNTAAKDVLGTTVGGYGQKFAQAYGAGATGPQPAQGSDMPAADGSGTPTPPQAENEWPTVRDFVRSKYPGAKVLGFRDGSIAYDKQGRVRIRLADGQDDAVEIPKGKDLQKGGGPFGGTSVEAQALNMLIANRTLSQQQAAELAAGKTITNPADGSVMFMTPSGLFGQKPGQPPQPVGAPGAAPPAAGQPGSGMIPVTPPKPVQMTEGQSNAALYADRMREADATITSNEKAGMSLGGKVLEAVPGGAGNYLQSDEYQLFEQARRNFINAVLRRESGAVIADSEFANAEKQYFPRPGDSDAVIKQKAANRRSAIEGVSRAAGSTYKPQGAGPPQAAPESGGEKRLTPEEAQKLPPGTTFIGTDGVQRVRR